MTAIALPNAIVAAGVRAVRERIAAACARAGRREDEVTLVAASKTRPPEAVLAALAAGITDFGENRPEEAAPKIEAIARLAPDAGLCQPNWHMIGHVQSRKARMVVGPYALLHSLDSTKLAFKLDQLAREQGTVLPVLLEVNLGDEESKYGFPAPDDNGRSAEVLLQAVESILPLQHLSLRGLMGMAPLTQSTEEARPYFRRLRLLREALRRDYGATDWEHLSMGMTDDFDVAIDEGATLVRVGRAIFGAREVT
ncbi:MAG: YggS family pyridoxal phosphate-dependent enzyme [Anaerolineae bacterium]